MHAFTQKLNMKRGQDLLTSCLRYWCVNVFGVFMVLLFGCIAKCFLPSWSFLHVHESHPKILVPVYLKLQNRHFFSFPSNFQCYLTLTSVRSRCVHMIFIPLVQENTHAFTASFNEDVKVCCNSDDYTLLSLRMVAGGGSRFALADQEVERWAPQREFLGRCLWGNTGARRERERTCQNRLGQVCWQTRTTECKSYSHKCTLSLLLPPLCFSSVQGSWIPWGLL